jgi:hypothetical protein
MNVRPAVGLAFGPPRRPIGRRPIYDVGIARGVRDRRILHGHMPPACNNVASIDVSETLP